MKVAAILNFEFIFFKNSVNDMSDGESGCKLGESI